MNEATTIDEPRKLARRTDPAASHAAAARVGEFAKKHRELILQVLTLHPAGMTVHEIASLCRLDAHAVGKRMAELEREGEVEVACDLMGEVTRPSPSGRPARVWRRCVMFVSGTKGGAA